MLDNVRIFIDMDGTLAKFNHNLKSEEVLYEEGYFYNLPPQENILKAIKQLAKMYPKNVFILSCYLSDSKYALKEKEEWLQKHIPEIPVDKWHFVPCGKKKADFVPFNVTKTDILIDDYGENLKDWKKACKSAAYIKVCKDMDDAITEMGKIDENCTVISNETDVNDIIKTIIHIAEFQSKE